MARKLQNVRNIGIIAHIDAGKTTVTEKMLFLSGAKHRSGKVDSGTTTTDDDEEEQNRGITIYSACVTFDWKDIHVNLLDTPGHVDFTAEVERSLRVLDGAVVVFSAREGVEAQSETVWRQADKYEVPRMAFINKLDREGAEFDRVFEEIKARLGANPVAIQMPVGQGPAHVNNPFQGVVDLIKMRYVTFADEGREQKEAPIPEAVQEEAEFAREQMLEALYNYSDEMAELAFAEKPIPNDLIRHTSNLSYVARRCTAWAYKAFWTASSTTCPAHLIAHPLWELHRRRIQRNPAKRNLGSRIPKSHFVVWCSRSFQPKPATCIGFEFTAAHSKATRESIALQKTKKKTQLSCGKFTPPKKTATAKSMKLAAGRSLA